MLTLTVVLYGSLSANQQSPAQQSQSKYCMTWHQNQYYQNNHPCTKAQVNIAGQLCTASQRENHPALECWQQPPWPGKGPSMLRNELHSPSHLHTMEWCSVPYCKEIYFWIKSSLLTIICVFQHIQIWDPCRSNKNWMEHTSKFHLRSYKIRTDLDKRLFHNDDSHIVECKLKDEDAKRTTNVAPLLSCTLELQQQEPFWSHTYPHRCSQPQEVLQGEQLSDPVAHPSLQEKSMSLAPHEKAEFFLVDFLPFSDGEAWQI